MEIGDIEIKLSAGTGLKGPIQVVMHLNVDNWPNSTHFWLGDTAPRTKGSHQGDDTAGGDPTNENLQHVAKEDLLKAPVMLEDRGKAAASEHLEILSSESLLDRVGVAGSRCIAKVFVGALMGLGSEHGDQLHLDLKLQAVAKQLGDKLCGSAGIQ